MVGSTPSLTRSGRPSAELALELALRQGVDGVAGEEAGSPLARGIRHGANARLPPFGGARDDAVRAGASDPAALPARTRGTPHRGAHSNAGAADAHHSSSLCAWAAMARARMANGAGRAAAAPPPRTSRS